MTGFDWVLVAIAAWYALLGILGFCAYVSLLRSPARHTSHVRIQRDAIYARLCRNAGIVAVIALVLAYRKYG